MKGRPHLTTALGAALVLGLGACAGATPSQPGPLTPGDRVRLTAPSVVPGEVQGEVREISEDELLVRVRPEDEVVIPLEALASLAIQRGTRRRVKEGALIGLLIETDVWEDQTLPLELEATPSGLGIEFRFPVGKHD